MPIDFTIDEPRRLIVTTGTGVLTFAEIIGVQDIGWSDPRFNPQFDHLIDLTAVTRLCVSGGEIWSLLNRNPYRSVASRTAIVASQPCVFGVGRMAEGYAAGTVSEISVFHDLPGALEWLGIPPPPQSIVLRAAQSH